MLFVVLSFLLTRVKPIWIMKNFKSVDCKKADVMLMIKSDKGKLLLLDVLWPRSFKTSSSVHFLDGKFLQMSEMQQ